MEGYLEVLVDACIDTLKILPILFLVYLLIEYLEYKKTFKFEKSNFLRGKKSPLFGALFGSVPQCGFSVVSTDLFLEKKISIGALIAVYIATSDEAIPIMLSDYHSIIAMLVLIATKIVFAILVGYLAMFLYEKVFFKKAVQAAVAQEQAKQSAALEAQTSENQEQKPKEVHHDHGCCHHNVEPEKFEWKHPIVHSLKIILFIFVINLILGTIIYFWGEENLANFLTSSYAFQPVFCILIGLIPNCAASVVLTELYLAGSLSFGAIIAGLSVNAGIGILFLFKNKQNLKHIAFILCMLIIPSLILGYALHYVPIDLLSIIK